MTICRTKRPTRTAMVSAPATPPGLTSSTPRRRSAGARRLRSCSVASRPRSRSPNLPEEEPGDEPGEDDEGDVEHHLGDAGTSPLDPEGPIDVGGCGTGELLDSRGASGGDVLRAELEDHGRPTRIAALSPRDSTEATAEGSDSRASARARVAFRAGSRRRCRRAMRAR